MSRGGDEKKPVQMVPVAHAVRPAENGDRLRLDLPNDCDRQVEALRGRGTPREMTHQYANEDSFAETLPVGCAFHFSGPDPHRRQTSDLKLATARPRTDGRCMELHASLRCRRPEPT